MLTVIAENAKFKIAQNAKTALINYAIITRFTMKEE
jgi:hypothetical protein